MLVNADLIVRLLNYIIKKYTQFPCHTLISVYNRDRRVMTARKEG